MTEPDAVAIYVRLETAVMALTEAINAAYAYGDRHIAKLCNDALGSAVIAHAAAREKLGPAAPLIPDVTRSEL